MTHISISELFDEAFSRKMLIIFDQDNTLPALPDNVFNEYLETEIFDWHAPILAQRKALQSTLNGTYSLPITTANYCLFIDILFEIIHDRAKFSANAIHLLEPLKPTILKGIMNHPQFFYANNHYLRRLLDDIFNLAIGLPHTAETGIYHTFTHALQPLKHITGKENMPSQTLQPLINFITQSHKQTAANEKQTIEHVTRFIHDHNDHRQVDEFIDQAIGNILLPDPIISLLHHQWRKTLHHYATAGDNKVWLQAQAFTHELISTYGHHPDNDTATPALTSIAKVHPNLTKWMRTTDNKHEHVDIYHKIESLNKSILNNAPIERTQAPALCEKNARDYAHLSKSVLLAAESLTPGQWLLHGDEKNPSNKRRLKIACSFSGGDFLLVNHLGEKHGLISHNALAYRLLSKQTTLLDSSELFTKLFAKSLESYLLRYKRARDLSRTKKHRAQKEQLRQQALAKAQHETALLRQQKQQLEQQITQQKQQDEQNQKLSEERIRQELANKIKTETEQLQQQKAEYESKLRQERQNKKQIQQQLESQFAEESAALKNQQEQLERQLQAQAKTNRRHEINQQILALNIGAWLSMKNRFNEMVPAKVAIIYASTGKYVFVDQTGIRIGEYTAQQLLEIIECGDAQILKNENNFEQSMERVIRSLKR